MSDWTGESIVDGFPRANATYWIQFITEPEIITKKGQYGGTYKQAVIRLQFFAPDKFGEYHYMGWGEKKIQPCVIEYLTEFGPDILTRLIEVKGVEHKKHVDLELVDSWDRISAKIEPLAPLTKPPTGPSKPAADSPIVSLDDSSHINRERGQPEPAVVVPPAAAGEPCSHHENAKLEGYEFCPGCGERVG